MRRLLPLLIFCLLLPGPARAQTDSEERDVGFLVGLIEDNLNTAARTVRIDGFAGALSSQATIQRLTIADSQGTWFTATDLRLEWNRSALFSGAIEITAATAGFIRLDRMPVPDPSLREQVEALPAPETSSFALPDLPVSVDIGLLEAERIEIGAPILGEDVAFTLSASASLAGGEGTATLDARRIDDGPEGTFRLDAAYSNTSTILTLDLRAAEGPGGLAVGALNVPGEPALSLTVSGTGPITSYSAEVSLVRAGNETIGGSVELITTRGDGGPPGRDVIVDLGGDVTGLFAPEFREFFGPDVRLQATGSREPDGAIRLRALDLRARALRLTGQARLSPQGWPEFFDVRGTVAGGDGQPVLLPLVTETRVRRLDLILFHDSSEGEDWRARFDILDLDRPEIDVAELSLDGGGEIAFGADPANRRITAALDYGATGIALADAALQRAVGSALSGALKLTYRDGEPVAIEQFTFTGAGMDAELSGLVRGLETGFRTDLSLGAEMTDFARLGPLTGLDLSGAGRIDVEGAVVPLENGFDLDIAAATRGLAVGLPNVDPLLRGEGRVDIAARRDETGLILEELRVVTDLIDASAEARITSGPSVAVFDVRLLELREVVPGLEGAARFNGLAAAPENGNLALTASLAAPGGVRAEVDAEMSGSESGRPLRALVDADVDRLGPYMALFGLDLGGAASFDGEVSWPADGPLSFTAAVTGPGGLAGDVGGDLDPSAGYLPANLGFIVALQDVAPYTALAGIDIAGPADLTGTAVLPAKGNGSLTVQVTGPGGLNGFVSGQADLGGDNLPASAAFDLTASDVASYAAIFGVEMSGPAGLTGQAELAASGRASADVTLSGPDGLSGTLAATTDVFDAFRPTEATFDLAAEEVARYAALAGVAFSGSARVTGSANVPAEGPARVDVAVTGPGGLQGTINAEADPDAGFRPAAVVLDLSAGDIAPYASLAGLPFGGPGAIAGMASVDVQGTARADLRLAGPGGLSAGIDLQAETEDAALPASGSLRLTVSDLSSYRALAGLPLSGAVRLGLDGDAALGDLTFDLTADAETTGLTTGIAQLDLLLRGTGTATGQVRRAADGGLAVDNLRARYNNFSIDADSTVTGGQLATNFSATLRDLGLFVPELSGPASASGTLRQGGGILVLDIDAAGPSGITANASGSYGPGNAADIALAARAPLGIANQFLGDIRLNGEAEADLRLSGALALLSLSGTVTTGGSRLAIPQLRTALEDMSARVALSGGAAQVSVAGAVLQGGTIAVDGRVTLGAPFAGDLTARLAGVVVTDGQIYQATADGAVRLTGPLAGGAGITGDITLGDVVLNVPSASFGSLGEIPEIRHVGDPPPVRLTRRYAGVAEGERAGAAASGGPSYGLDVLIRAPRGIFVRGRGLDAELGGSLRVTGTTSSIVPQGGFELIRGRLSLLGQRLDFVEGSITLLGDFIPSIRFVSVSERDDVTVQIIIDGPATDPDIRFRSSPELPQDEVLSYLLFGRSLTQISPLQAVQLAAGVAALAGRGGGGLVDGLREGFGLDDLDLTTAEDGSVAVRAGRYLSENVYTDVTVGSDGKAEINLNLDITDSLTVTGRAASDGETGLGLFYQLDY